MELSLNTFWDLSEISFSKSLEDRIFQPNSLHFILSSVATKHRWLYKDGKMQEVYLWIVTLPYTKPYQFPEITTFSCFSLTLNKGPIPEASKPGLSLPNMHWRKHPTQQTGTFLCLLYRFHHPSHFKWSPRQRTEMLQPGIKEQNLHKRISSFS